MPKLQIPTGFESLQEQAKSRRTLAEKMQELGLQNNQGYRSWTQVLGQLGDAWAGRSLNKEADKLDSDYRTQLLNAYSKAHGDFNDAVSAGKTPEQLRAQFGNNPYTEDDLKLYTPGITKGVEKQAENANTYVPTPDRGYQPLLDQRGRVPFDPNKTVVSTDNGKTWGTNPVKITADRLAQGNGPQINAVTSIPAPNPPMPPSPMPPTPTAGPGVPPAPPPTDPNRQPASGMDLSLLKPDERQILVTELARRASGGQIGGPTTVLNPMHVPMGNPLTAQKPPDGITVEGKPYWMVNGVPYDNPEGK